MIRVQDLEVSAMTSTTANVTHEVNLGRHLTLVQFRGPRQGWRGSIRCSPEKAIEFASAIHKTAQEILDNIEKVPNAD